MITITAGPHTMLEKKSAGKLTRIRLVMPYYDNPMMLAAHMINWWSYPKEILDRMSIVIVDDCSKVTPASAIIQDSPLPITLYRINTDIPWNQHGARNLGMWDLKDNGKSWCLLTDMDVVFPASEMHKIQSIVLEPSYHYTFERKKMPGLDEKKHHPNTILVRSEFYWNAGGYDEDYCGTYGGDGPFHKSLKEITTWAHFKDIYCHYYGRTYITDSGTNDLDRREIYNKKYREVFEKKRQKNGVGTVPKDWLRFDWEKIR